MDRGYVNCQRPHDRDYIDSLVPNEGIQTSIIILLQYCDNMEINYLSLLSVKQTQVSTDYVKINERSGRPLLRTEQGGSAISEGDIRCY